jgi:hypothetical protein
MEAGAECRGAKGEWGKKVDGTNSRKEGGEVAGQEQCGMGVFAWSLPVHTPVATHCSPLGPPKSGYSFTLFVLLPPRFPSPRMWSSYAVYVLAMEPG